MVIASNALLRRLRTQGEVRLSGSRIGGALEFDGSVLTNEGAQALVAESVTVGGNLLGRMDGEQRMVVNGEFDLAASKVGGALELQGALLLNPGGRALFADRIVVDGNAQLHGGLYASGQLRLAGARIGGQLVMDGAELLNPGDIALVGDRMIVTDDVLLRWGFRATGLVRLPGAQISGDLMLDGAVVRNEGPDAVGGWAIDLSGARVGQGLSLRLHAAPRGGIDLSGAHVSVLHDEPATWPDRLRLRGFRYDDLQSEPEVRVVARLGTQRGVGQEPGWIARDPEGYLPQPYEQLRAYYRQHGREAEARLVAIARERDRRAVLPRLGRLWNAFLGFTVGYGYQTWRAAVAILVLIAIGTVIFAAAHPAHFAPVRATVPEFNPMIYAVDALVPVLTLGHRDVWIAYGAAGWCTFAFKVAGWVLTTAVVAGVASVLKRG
jgi:hypothetical protein